MLSKLIIMESLEQTKKIPKKDNNIKSNIRLLKEDSIVTTILSDPSKLLESPHFDSIKLNGFLGSSTQEGFWRLYIDSRLDEFVEIRENDILRTEKANGKTTLYIKNGTKFFHVKVVTEKNYESESDKDESTSDGFKMISLARPGQASEMASERRRAERERREREHRERTERRQREIREMIDKVKDFAPDVADALTEIGVNLSREMLGKVADVLEILSQEIGPEDWKPVAAACMTELENIKVECEEVKAALERLEDTTAAMDRAKEIEREAKRKESMMRDRPREFLRDVDRDMIDFNRDLQTRDIG